MWAAVNARGAVSVLMVPSRIPSPFSALSLWSTSKQKAH